MPAQIRMIMILTKGAQDETLINEDADDIAEYHDKAGKR